MTDCCGYEGNWDIYSSSLSCHRVHKCNSYDVLMLMTDNAMGKGCKKRREVVREYFHTVLFRRVCWTGRGRG